MTDAIHNILVLAGYIGISYAVWFGFEKLTNLKDIQGDADGKDNNKTTND